MTLIHIAINYTNSISLKFRNLVEKNWPMTVTTTIILGTFIFSFLKKRKNLRFDIYNDNTNSDEYCVDGRGDTIKLELEVKFDQASLQAKEIFQTGKIGDVDKLMMYGLYKQAVIGDRNVEPPSKLDIVAFSKYNAWGKFTSMPMEIAMVKYIEVVNHFASKFKLTTQNNGDDKHFVSPRGNGKDIGDELIDNTASDDDDHSLFDSVSLAGFGIRQSTLMDTQHSDSDSPLSTLQNAARLGDVSLLKKSLNNGFNVHEADETGQTALHFAADKGYNDCITVLLEAGANVNATDGDEMSVLQIAVISGHVDSVALLLRAGANPDQQDTDGDTPRTCAEDDNNIMIIALFKDE